MATSAEHDAASNTQVVLQVGIVGAGIAGLCAAIAFRNAGHQVEVYERSHFRQEVGAAIVITPNAGKVLKSWGLDVVVAGGSHLLKTCTMDPYTFQSIREAHFHDTVLDQSRLQVYCRADLHNALRQLAQDCSRSGPPVKLKRGMDVSSIDCEHSVIHFLKAGSIQKDVVVCADGFKSATMPSVLGYRPALAVGRAVYRTLIPVSNIKGDADIWDTFERLDWASIDTPFDLHGSRCDIHPIPTSGMISVAIGHVIKAHEYGKEDWNSPATLYDVLDLLKDMHPFFGNLVRHADYFNCFTIRIREPPPFMAKYRTAILGDAAHAMQPVHAQGTCMCMEDAAALQVLFKDFTKTDSVELRLQLFNQLRMPRIGASLLYSNAMYYTTKAAEWGEKLRTYYAGRIPTNLTPWNPQSQMFLWNYNAFKEARKALKYKNRLGGMPTGAVDHFGL